MKSRINVKEMKFTVPGADMDTDVLFGGAEIEVEYTLDEARGLWSLQKKVLEETPELMDKFIEKTIASIIKLEKGFKNNFSEDENKDEDEDEIVMDI